MGKYWEKLVSFKISGKNGFDKKTAFFPKNLKNFMKK